uniref:Cecropin-like molecule CLM n=1 Tax=Biomphalaria glabrata TaxID=6526 RepID=Q9NJP5_BIOGL|nr:cecropin-like molecule CLM [Biomphalaria glabrata]
MSKLLILFVYCLVIAFSLVSSQPVQGGLYPQPPPSQPADNTLDDFWRLFSTWKIFKHID